MHRVLRPGTALRLAGGLAGLAVVGGAVAVLLADGDGHQRPGTFELTVNRAPGDGVPTHTVEVPEQALDAARPLLEQGLRVPPADASAAERAAARAAAARIRASERPLPTAGATQAVPGCATRFVRNQSSRAGVRPQVQVLHYTVSPNRPGWSDVNAIVALFDTPSFQASSHFVIDDEGNCAYVVPIEAKAWTQAGGNPFAISYEIVATGRERTYLAPPGLAKLRLVMREVAHRTAIPLRRGAVSGCAPSRGGIVQHADGGVCWGGHGDIAPFPVQPVVDAVAAPDAVPSPLTAVERRIVRGVARPHGSGHSRRFWCARDHAQRAAIRSTARAERDGWRVRERARRHRLLARAFAESCR